ncbi:disulfide bond corrector protein DsbC [Ancylomarina subtilis]|uniref:Disulfide bond corrector protein DsbC n=1 Tax=Ancylomarina subtilis TaxID=1639035 RepID=A0A4V2FT19_9BACT|nr:protein-disulfide reductase DsbD domain-containing protein [Ancylomarina subtilis]RZT96405.1 disulfide bond corrector protein DsbC [Ancylomarina subtilis]
MKNLICLLGILFFVHVHIKGQSFDRNFYDLSSDGMEQLNIRIFTDYDKIEIGGEFVLAVCFDLEEDWHTYTAMNTGKNRPTSIILSLPDGIVVNDTIWPGPVVVESSKGGTNMIYDSDFMVLYKLCANKKINPSKIGVNASFQVCSSDLCMLGEASLETQIVTGENKKNCFYDGIQKELKLRKK